MTLTQKKYWKIGLFALAILIVASSLLYSNLLVKRIAKEERQKVALWAEAIQKKASLISYTNDLFDKIKTEERKRVELWANATKMLTITESNMDLNFYLDVVKSNTTIPVLLTNDEGEIASWLNLDSIHSTKKTELTDEEKKYLATQLAAMKEAEAPIIIDLYGGKKNYIYHSNSKIFAELKHTLDDLIKSFISEVVINSASAPVLFTSANRKNILAYGNIDSNIVADSTKVENLLAEMANQNTPIEIKLSNNDKNYIFYKDSYLLTQLTYYPFVQFGIIGLFLLIAYSLFNTARKSEQNKVWVGMAKETAHQLGTPLSSLMAWLELFKEKYGASEDLSEIEKDIIRLQTITERFSKIGSKPVLEKLEMQEVIEDICGYMRLRTSSKVAFSVNVEKGTIGLLNKALFEWACENIIKNAVDSMNGVGSISIQVSDQVQFVYIDITDSGKGIPKTKFNTIFEPGYTTKKRGWGLGLSLTKRIIEEYHNGKLFVKSSEINKGTCFRIVLKKQE